MHGCRRSDRGDLVALMLRACSSVDDFVEAARGVVPEAEVRRRHAEAANFGQFRMVVANRIRGEIARERQRMGAARRGSCS